MEADIFEMSSKEYLGWIDYHNRIPFVAERQDILLANLLAVTCNINRSKDTPALTAYDFMPWFVKSTISLDKETADKNMVSAKNMFKKDLIEKTKKIKRKVS